MTTYKVSEEWKTFKEFIFKELSNVDKNEIGFMYNENEIYIRATDQNILNIIKSKYDLVQTKQPKNFFQKDGEWSYMGNNHFFDLEI